MDEEAILPDTDASLRMWPELLSAYDVTLPTAAENLALDEALLAAVEADPAAACLRFWEPKDYFVVLGRSNKAETEVNLSVCEAEGIPILRRASGGGTVLVGPGCLCYTLALPLNEEHRALGVSQVTSRLMERTTEGLRTVLPEVKVCGTSDLVWQDRKFSGNAQRWLRRAFVHHGTLLYDFPLPMLARCLAQPTRQPDYRQSREHLEFVTNVPVTTVQTRNSMMSVWNAVDCECSMAVVREAKLIVESRYRSTEWHHRVVEGS